MYMRTGVLRDTKERKVGKKEIFGKSQNWVEAKPSAQFPF